jgi:hypothetical protein
VLETWAGRTADTGELPSCEVTSREDGISASEGGGTGCAVHDPSASATAAGVWYRAAGAFASIRANTAAIPSGTSGRASRTGGTVRFWCQSSFCCTLPSANGARPVSR